MKFILTLVALLIPCCEANDKRHVIKAEADENMLVILYDRGKEVSERNIKLEGQLGEEIKTWLTSAALENEDRNSYVPSVILQGKKLKVNFQKGKTIISVKPNDDPQTYWEQYSRSPNMQDRKMRALLMKVGEAKD